MLGWEYPPRFAGGLGKACQGLSQAMAREGAQVFFVLPTFPEKVSERHLEVIGAKECLKEMGSVIIQRSEARLLPYGGLADRPVYEVKSSVRPQLKLSSENSVEAPLASSEIYGTNLWSEIEKYGLTVRHLAETHEVDLVHAHDWMTFHAAFEFRKATGVPVYLHVHATEYDRSGDQLNPEIFKIEREGFRKANHIFTVSRYTAGILERLYGVNRKKITVIYNAPENGIEKKRVHATLDERDRAQVLFLGRLTYQKGPDHFLRAAELVHKVLPRARFVLCGSGDMLERLKHQAHRLGIEANTHFAGFVEPAGVDEVLLRSQVLVMPSVSEPFGLVALEAIRCGIPVILSKQSGVREVLSRALQVDFWDHERLADQILASLRLPELTRQLVEEGLAQLRELSWEKSAIEVIDTYRRHLGRTYAEAIGGMRGH